MSNKKDLTDLVSQIDSAAEFKQLAEIMTNLSNVCSTYFTELIKNGIPPELAAQLVLDWHKIFWAKTMDDGTKSNE